MNDIERELESSEQNKMKAKKNESRKWETESCEK